MRSISDLIHCSTKTGESQPDASRAQLTPALGTKTASAASLEQEELLTCCFPSSLALTLL